MCDGGRHVGALRDVSDEEAGPVWRKDQGGSTDAQRGAEGPGQGARPAPRRPRGRRRCPQPGRVILPLVTEHFSFTRAFWAVCGGSGWGSDGVATSGQESPADADGAGCGGAQTPGPESLPGQGAQQPAV